MRAARDLSRGAAIRIDDYMRIALVEREAFVIYLAERPATEADDAAPVACPDTSLDGLEARVQIGDDCMSHQEVHRLG